MTRRVLAVPMMLPLLFTAACGSTEQNVDEETALEWREEGHWCTLASCTSGLDLRLPVNVSVEKLRASTLSVCHNTLCYASSLATLGNTIHFPDPSKRDTEHTPLIMVSLDIPASGALQLRLRYDTWSLKDVQDGDVYDVTLTDERGERFVEVHETVSYKVLQPNGPDCGPTCGRVTIDKT